MASNYTENYGLCQWEATDQVLRTDFNADNQRIDAVLKGLADQDKTLEQTLAEQAAAIAKLGNCSIERFTEFTSNTMGAQFSFTRPPLLFLIVGTISVTIGSCLSDKAVRIYYDSASHTTSLLDFPVTWQGNTAQLSAQYMRESAYQTFGLSVSED